MNLRLLMINSLYASIPGLTLVAIVSCKSQVNSANISTSLAIVMAADTMQTDIKALDPCPQKIKITGQLAASDPKTKMTIDEDGYYSTTDTPPMFDGGEKALEKYVSQNMEHPPSCTDLDNKTVKVQFGINEKGIVDHVTALDNKAGYGVEEEAMKLVLNMPSWKPAIVQGRPVKSLRTLLIHCELDKN